MMLFISSSQVVSIGLSIVIETIVKRLNTTESPEKQYARRLAG